MFLAPLSSSEHISSQCQRFSSTTKPQTQKQSIHNTLTITLVKCFLPPVSSSKRISSKLHCSILLDNQNLKPKDQARVPQQNSNNKFGKQIFAATFSLKAPLLEILLNNRTWKQAKSKLESPNSTVTTSLANDLSNSEFTFLGN